VLKPAPRRTKPEVKSAERRNGINGRDPELVERGGGRLCRIRVTLDARRAVAFRGELLAPRHFEEGVTETLGFRPGR
jgi:hypothetical protein